MPTRFLQFPDPFRSDGPRAGVDAPPKTALCKEFEESVGLITVPIEPHRVAPVLSPRLAKMIHDLKKRRLTMSGNGVLDRYEHRAALWLRMP